MSHGVNTLPIKCVMKLPWESDFHSGKRVDEFVGRIVIDQHTEELEQSVWWEKAPKVYKQHYSEFSSSDTSSYVWHKLGILSWKRILIKDFSFILLGKL